MSEHFDRLKSALADRYSIDREIGRGGMAVVYLAEDLKHGRPVAIKVLQPSLSATLGTDRFLREIETAARLNHPHILPLYDSGEADGFLYYVMPYVEGDSLRDRIDREGQLPIEESVRLTREVAGGLDYAHSEGVIHRDIKPGNIMLSQGHAVIADFGIAQALDEAGGEKLTSTGVSTGSPIYMSPEQARGSERLDGRTDLYSLGCVLYEMLAGEPPFTGGTHASITARKEMQAAPSLRTLRDTVPEGVEGAVSKALAKVPADRHSTAGEFANALSSPATTDRQSATRPSPMTRPRAIVGGVIAAAILAVIVIGYLLLNRQSDPGAPMAGAGSVADPGVAVLPFRVVGADFEFWREGMVVMLSDNLEGIGGLRKIDPAVVMMEWGRSVGEGGDAASPEAAIDVARTVGARYAVTGSVVELQGALRVAADVHDVASKELRGSAQVDGPSDSVLALVDRLTLELLRQELVPADADQQGVNLSRATTTSLPALKAYVAGEQNFLAGRFKAASADYQRAIEIDSTFARAMYRLSRAAGWAALYDVSYEAGMRAMRFVDRLPERDSLLLDGNARELVGLPALETFTRRYPDDVDGWVALGDQVFHHGARALYPASTVRNALDRAVELSPYFAEAYMHLIEDAFVRLDSARAQELIADFGEMEREATTCITFELAYDLVWGSDSAKVRAASVIDTISDYVFWECAQVPMAVTPDVSDKLERIHGLWLKRDHSLARQLALWRIVQLRVSRGQIGRLRQVLDAAESLPELGTAASRWQVMLHVSGFPDSTAAHRAAGVLERGLHPTDLFWVGALAVSEGRWQDVERVSRALDAGVDDWQTQPFGDRLVAWAPAYATALRALSEVHRGDDDRIADLRAVLLEFPAMSVTSEMTADYLRFEIGRLLIERQDWLEAERVFRSFHQYHFVYTTQAPLYLGRVYEALGRREAAAENYARSITWWEYADPELQPWIEEAREALVRLGPLDQ